MAINLEKLPPKIRALVARVEERRGQATRVHLVDGLRLNIKLEVDPKDPRGGLRSNWCKLPLSAVGEIREKSYSQSSTTDLDAYARHKVFVSRVGERGNGRAPNEKHIEQVLRWADIVPCYCEICVYDVGLQGEGTTVATPNGSVPRDLYLLRANLAVANKIDVNRRDAWKDVEAILNGTYEPPAPEPVVVAEAEPVAEPVEVVASVETVQVIEVVEPPPDEVWCAYGIDVEVDPEFALPSLAELRARITEVRAC